MSQTLQQVLDTVLLESGMPTESAYADSDDDAVKRLVNLANRSVRQLAKHPWQAIRATYTFTLSSDTQYPLPADYRAFVPDTMYEANRVSPVDFPAGEGEWAYLKSSNSGSGPRTRVRLLGNVIEVHEPVSGETVRVEYLTDCPVLDTDGTTKKARFDADTDTCLLDDDLLEMDIIWRYKKLMGLQDWQVDLAAFRAYESHLRGTESGAKTITPGEGTFQTPYYDLWRPVPNDP